MEKNNNNNGINLRDYFASKAMQGIVSCESTNEFLREDYKKAIDNISNGSYLIADAMLEAREK